MCRRSGPVGGEAGDSDAAETRSRGGDHSLNAFLFSFAVEAVEAFRNQAPYTLEERPRFTGYMPEVRAHPRGGLTENKDSHLADSVIHAAEQLFRENTQFMFFMSVVSPSWKLPNFLKISTP